MIECNGLRLGCANHSAVGNACKLSVGCCEWQEIMDVESKKILDTTATMRHTVDVALTVADCEAILARVRHARDHGDTAQNDAIHSVYTESGDIINFRLRRYIDR